MLATPTTTARTHRDWPACRFSGAPRSATCNLKARNGWKDSKCSSVCPVDQAEEVQPDLRNYATADLVEELERREKVLVVETFTGRSGGYVVRADSISCPKTISGPARILVVRDEQP